MELTTGAILRRITETDLSASAHKLATIILDGIAWKDGYNGLERGTAAFTLAHLAEKMGVSRQHLTALCWSNSQILPWRWSGGSRNGKFAPWLFRFGAVDDAMARKMSCQPQATHHYLENLKNKTIFAGRIEIDARTNVYQNARGQI